MPQPQRLAVEMTQKAALRQEVLQKVVTEKPAALAEVMRNDGLLIRCVGRRL